MLVVIGRFVNFLVPLVFAEIVKIFEEGSKVSPWPYLFGYVALRFLQASGGLAALRDVSAVARVRYVCADGPFLGSLGSSYAVLGSWYVRLT